MRGDVSFAVLLVSYGNLRLSSRQSPIPLNVPSDLLTLNYIDSVDFVHVGRSSLIKGGVSVAKTIEGWFDHLQGEGARRLRLVLGLDAQPEQRRVMEELGSRLVGVQADSESRNEFWVPEWSTDGSFMRQRIWRVSVKGVEVTRAIPPSPVDLESAKEDLRDVFKAAIDVAGKMGANGFATHFRNGLEALDSDSPTPPYYPEMIPPFGYELLARQLIVGASYGWVFGGMGSWNDIGSSDAAIEREYEEVTDRLLYSVQRGLADGVNSFRI